MKEKRNVWLLGMGLLIVSLVLSISCTTTKTVEREYTQEGSLSYERDKTNDQVNRELRRVFLNTVLEGIGIYENENEGLARSTAIDLAVAELAGKVQTVVRSEAAMYNNQDVRRVVETQVKAIVGNYNIDSSGYDPGTYKYRVRISIKGEQLIREIETRISR